jgi:alkylation response protein AidB-like acyl-CoA dehydrogenase
MIPHALDARLADWLDAHAGSLDTATELKADVVPQLARAGVFRVGVPVSLGGTGGDTSDAIAAIAAVAERSLSAAFVFWGQRTFTEYLLQSPNAQLREGLLAPLLDGTIAGATGLSNAMKYLSGIEALQIEATSDAHATGHWRLTGKLAWVSNLRPEGFVVAAAVAHRDTQPASIFAIPHNTQGVARSADLDLIALRGSNTAALRFADVALERHWQLHADAATFLPAVRPAFLGLQCGLSIGLARRSLTEAARAAESTRGILGSEIETAAHALEGASARLVAGISEGVFRVQPSLLFELRIELAEITRSAINLELQASGGRGYLRDAGLGFERRWREAAFIPIVTPSLIQLRSQLAQRTRSEAAYLK